MKKGSRRRIAVPIYEYRCRKCESVVERIQGLNDRPLSKCPSCGGKVERLMSSGAFHLKGSGWYATDYAGKGKKPEACPAAGSDAGPACAACPKASGE